MPILMLYLPNWEYRQNILVVVAVITTVLKAHTPTEDNVIRERDSFKIVENY